MATPRSATGSVTAVVVCCLVVSSLLAGHAPSGSSSKHNCCIVDPFLSLDPSLLPPLPPSAVHCWRRFSQFNFASTNPPTPSLPLSSFVGGKTLPDGQSHPNIAGKIVSGMEEGVDTANGLTELGLEQARTAGKELKEVLLRAGCSPANTIVSVMLPLVWWFDARFWYELL